MPCGIDDALALLDQLEEVRRTELTRYTKLEVGGHTFGYLWYPTRTMGLKQTLAEQLALTTERPDVFEGQFTAGGFGWIGVPLEGIERDELAELVFEAWRLTAWVRLRDQRGGQLRVWGRIAPAKKHPPVGPRGVEW